MAFNRAELSLMATTGAGAAQQHLYFYANTATDTVTAANFFNPAEAQINTGDLLYVPSNGRMVRMVNTAGVITLTALNTGLS